MMPCFGLGHLVSGFQHQRLPRLACGCRAVSGWTVRDMGSRYALLSSGKVAVMAPVFMFRITTLAAAMAMR